MSIFEEKIEYKDGWEQAVLCINITLTEKGRRGMDRIHYHEYMELLFGLEGCASVLVGDRVFDMKKGDLVVINAREMHDVIWKEGRARYFVVKFLPKLLYSHGESLSGIRYLLPLWQKEIAFSPVASSEQLAGSGVDGYMENIMREWENRSIGFELVMHANIMQVFVWMLRNKCSQSTREADIPLPIKKILQGVLKETSGHLLDWNTADAAEFAGLSYSYFSRNFKLAFGISFSSYIESLRLHEAERLLLAGDTDITEIALSLGFCSTSYFIERFRKKYGMSPRVFRGEMRNS